MGWTMRALVWRFTKLFEKWGDHHHRSGEEEPLVERRKEGLALSIKEESESFVTFYQARKWKFCHDNCLSCWVLIVSAWYGLVAKVLAINVQNFVSLLKQLRPGAIIIIKKCILCVSEIPCWQCSAWRSNSVLWLPLRLATLPHEYDHSDVTRQNIIAKDDFSLWR